MAKKNPSNIHSVKNVAKPEFFRGGQLMVSTDDAKANFEEVPNVQQRLYLQAIAQYGPRYGMAAKAAGVCAATGYNWRYTNPDPVFAAALERATKIGIERLEGEMIRRGFEGMEKPVYQSGRLVGTIREYSDSLAMFVAKGFAPEKYRDRVEHSGPQGGPIQTQAQVAILNLSDEEVRQRLEQARSALLEAPSGAPSGLLEQRLSQDEERAEAEYAKKLADRAAAKGGNGNGSGNGHG